MERRGTVVVDGAPGARLCVLLVSGDAALNRALDGDEVVVEVGATAAAPRVPQLLQEDGPADLLHDDDVDAFAVGHGGSGSGANSGSSGSSSGETPHAAVIAILARRHTTVVATILPARATTAGGVDGAAPVARAAAPRWMWAIPMDAKLPRMRLRSAIGGVAATEGEALRVVVAVDGWGADESAPTAHYVATLGRAFDADAEVRAIVARWDLTPALRPFPPAAAAAAPPLPPSCRWSVAWEAARLAALGGDSARLTTRRDLRWTVPVCSIDPVGCVDIDDAVSVRTLPGGHLEVGVHIADVEYFLPAGGALDDEARRRAAAVYLADRHLPMLPRSVAEAVCSLRARVDRLTVSVMWELAPVTAGGEVDYEVVAVWAGRTLIRNGNALTYQQAAALIDGRDAPPMLTARAPPPTSPPLPADFDELEDDLACGGLGGGASAVDPAAYTPAALAARRAVRQRYGDDPLDGGRAGAAIAPEDVAPLRERLRALTAVAAWRSRRRRAAGGMDMSSPSTGLRIRVRHGAGEVAWSGPSSGAAGAVEASGRVDGVSARGGAPGGGGGLGSGVDIDIGLRDADREQINTDVAELMVFANETVARLTYALTPASALLLTHGGSDAGGLADLRAAAAAAGFALDDAHGPSDLARSVHAFIRAAAASGVDAAQVATYRAIAARVFPRSGYSAGAAAAGSGAGTTAAAAAAAAEQCRLLAAVAAEGGSAGGVVRAEPVGGRTWWLSHGGAATDGSVMDLVPASVGLGHVGLGVALYTHFSSPIHRYVDVCAHRALVAALASLTPAPPARMPPPPAPSSGPAPAPAAPAPTTTISSPPLAASSGGDDDDFDVLALLEDSERAPVGSAYAAARPAVVALPSPPPAPPVAGGLHLQHAGSTGSIDAMLSLLDEFEPPSQPPPAAFAVPAAPAPVLAPSSSHGNDLSALMDLLDMSDGGGAPPAPAPAPSPAPVPALPPAPAAPSPATAAAMAAPHLPALPSLPPHDHAAVVALCRHLNDRASAAKAAVNAVNDLFFGLFFRGRVEFATARVTRVSGRGVTVYVPAYDLTAEVVLVRSATETDVAGGAGVAAGAGAVCMCPPALLAHVEEDEAAMEADDVAVPRGLASRMVPQLSPAAAAALTGGGALCCEYDLPAEAVARTEAEAASSGAFHLAVPTRRSPHAAHLWLRAMQSVKVAITCEQLAATRRAPVRVELVSPDAPRLVAAATGAAAAAAASATGAAAATAAASPAATGAGLYDVIRGAAGVGLPPTPAAGAPPPPRRRAPSAPPAVRREGATGRLLFGGYVPPPARAYVEAEAYRQGARHDWGDSPFSLDDASPTPRPPPPPPPAHNPFVRRWGAADHVSLVGGGADTRNAIRQVYSDLELRGFTETTDVVTGSAYGTKTGAGLSTSDLTGSYAALRSAETAAMERAGRLRAERRHDRIDAEKRKKK